MVFNEQCSDPKPTEVRYRDFQWTWKQLEATFAYLHNIASQRRPAFNAKLRHLQRCGVLTGTNRGKGTAVKYGAAHVIDLGFALELLQLGLEPEHAALLLQRFRTELFKRALLAAEELLKPTRHNDYQSFLIFDPEGLAYLQCSQTEAAQLSAQRSLNKIDVRPPDIDSYDRLEIVNVERLVANIVKAADAAGTCAYTVAAMIIRDRLQAIVKR